MKIYAIRDRTDRTGKDLGWLLYFEADGTFYTELPREADPARTPMPFDAFLEKGKFTVGAEWSGRWVRERIVPAERQNLPSVLKAYGLEEYDEYRMLVKNDGKCEQDDFYLTEVEEKDLPEEILDRFGRKVRDAVALEDGRMLLFLRDGSVRLWDPAPFFAASPRFGVIARDPGLFREVRVQSGGYGVRWDENLEILYPDLFDLSVSIPLPAGWYPSAVCATVLTAGEAAEMLGCSRQYISELTRKGRLSPLKETGNGSLFLRSDILEILWN